MISALRAKTTERRKKKGLTILSLKSHFGTKRDGLACVPLFKKPYTSVYCKHQLIPILNM